MKMLMPPKMDEASRQRWALHRAVVIGMGLSIASACWTVFLWVMAVREPAVSSILPAVLVTVALVFFAWLTRRALIRKRSAGQ
jgi:hypothetical protein